MIDLHAHVLPGFDDGPATLEDALAMLRQAEADGVTEAVATPHVMKGSYDHTRESIARGVAELNAAARAAGINVTVHPGGELYLDFDLLAMVKEQRAITLGAGRYVLLEFPALGIPQGMDEIIFNLQISGYHPVLAHPERNLDIVTRPPLLYELCYKGVLVQQNTGSLLGYFGRAVQQVAKTFLDHRLVHVVASDAHDAKQRCFMHRAWTAAAVPLLGAEAVQQLTRVVPGAIVRGEEIDVNEPLQLLDAGWLAKLQTWWRR